jgi:outer membrane biosynthesis protein TonB
MTRRFGELDHTELVHLLDSLEGDQSRSRFRESIYISIIVYLLLAWLLVYGPKYIFHPGKVVPTAASLKEKERLTQLEMQHELAKAPPKPPKIVPKLDRKALEQLREMARENAAARLAPTPPAPAPQAQVQPPPQPAPAPAPPPPAVAQNQLPQAPMPQPAPRPAAPSNAIPDAPHPAAPAPSSALSQSMNDVAKSTAQPHFGGGRPMPGSGARVGQQTAGAGAEILSDTQGIDFDAYIRKLLREVQAAWEPLIPEEVYPPISKEGWTLIRFTIEPNGVVSHMGLDDSTHDRAIDKAAWGSINSIGQFAPLPKGYKGSLELRIQFVITHNARDTQ